MRELTFVTGNDLKFKTASHHCAKHGITLVQQDIETVEIQAEIGEPIARHKANEAFQKLQKPVIVTDDTWVIPGLNGFPGPYMKSMNHWFTPQNWLDLTRNLEDREIILRQIAVYQDEMEQVVFTCDLPATLLKEVRGEHKFSHLTILSFGNSGKSAAESLAEGVSAIGDMHTVWNELTAWLEAKES